MSNTSNGFLLGAFRYGVPPHSGIVLGLNHLVMILTGAKSLRDVIASPKTPSAHETMSNTPAPVDEDQLEDLHIQLVDLAEEEESELNTKTVKQLS